MRNYSLDTLKIICAICVIYIHTPKPEILSDYITPIIRCAVPIFFMISGYFTYGKTNLNNTLRRRIVEQLKIFAWALALYFIVFLIKDGKGALNYISSLATPVFFMFNFIKCGEHLWYILAYIYVLVIMLFVEKYNLYKLLFYMTPVLLTVALLAGSYSEILIGRSLPACYTRNFLFTGLPFFTLGMMVKSIRYKIPISALITFCTIFYIFGIFENTKMNLSNSELFLSTPFLAVAIFVLFLNINQIKDNIFSKTGREDGLYIYVLHFFIAMYVAEYRAEFPQLLYIGPILVLCLTLLLIAFLRKINVIGKII